MNDQNPMCGRYTLTRNDRRFAKEFAIIPELDFAPHYNIAPTQQAPVLAVWDGKPHLSLMRWGLVPYWAKDEKIGNSLINARAETVAEKPSFRTAFRRQRCLVLADGFYEWKKIAGGKQPFRFLLKSRDGFAFAGLWDRWRRASGEEVQSFTIITTTPNELCARVHDRMPVILREDDYALWLNPEISDRAKLQALLCSYPAAEMESYPVSRIVNSPDNNVPECVERLALKCRTKQPKIGDRVRVKHCWGAYMLPAGLEPGTVMKVIGTDIGRTIVECEGKEWNVSMTNIEPFDEFLVDGQWLDEIDPRVIAARAALEPANNPQSA